MNRQKLTLPTTDRATRDILKRKSINFIVEANLNIGLALSLVRLNFRYISLSQKMDDETMKKIQSIAKEKKVIILFTENFLNLENYL